MFSIVKQRKIWFAISGVFIIISVVAIIAFGLKLGIDFEGGSLLEVQFNQQVTRPNTDSIEQALSALHLGSITTQSAENNGLIIRFKTIDEQTHQQILTTLNQAFLVENLTGPAVEEKQFNSIGPSVGAELKTKTIWAIVMVVVAIVLYMSWAFRKVSKPVASWKYGLIAIIALFHDVLFTVGAFAILGKVYGMEVNAPFVAAILTVMGYSVNDTIVVFDRTRENLTKNPGMAFENIVQKSLDEVIIRSINTSFTSLLALFAVFLLGGASVRDFILALIIGIIVGTYSSIFIATPLLVTWERLTSKK